MSLNLGGGYFNPSDFGHSQLNAPDLMGRVQSRAVLFVFRPYRNQFGNVALRPFVYNFDDNFLGQVQEKVDLAQRQSIHSSTLVNDMADSINLNQYMMPSPKSPMMFHGDHLSDKYRFILVFSTSARDLFNGNTISTAGSNSQIRRIYTGYLEDEPFSQLSMKRSLNPQAFLVITHKTVLGTSMEMGRLGPSTMINTTSSEEMVHPSISKNLTSFAGDSRSGLFLMTPENCMNNIEVNDEGYSLSTPGARTDITNDNGVNVIPDLLEIPGRNIKSIMKGIVRYQDHITHRPRLLMNRHDSHFDQMFDDEIQGRIRLGNELAIPRSSKRDRFDLDENDRISVLELSTMVNGDLDVQPIGLGRPQYYETADQSEESFVNQFSYLIASVMGPILNHAGLNSLQFDYQIARMSGEVDYKFTIYGSEANWVLPENDHRSTVRAVENELHRGVFSTIFQSLGAFHVMVSSNVTGTTTIRLNLVEQGYRNHVDFEIPTSLGGLISPLIGDTLTNAVNSEAVETLYTLSTGTPKSFNQNDHDFMNYAEGGSWAYQNVGRDANTGRMTPHDLELD